VRGAAPELLGCTWATAVSASRPGSDHSALMATQMWTQTRLSGPVQALDLAAVSIDRDCGVGDCRCVVIGAVFANLGSVPDQIGATLIMGRSAVPDRNRLTINRSTDRPPDSAIPAQTRPARTTAAVFPAGYTYTLNQPPARAKSESP